MSFRRCSAKCLANFQGNARILHGRGCKLDAFGASVQIAADIGRRRDPADADGVQGRLRRAA